MTEPTQLPAEIWLRPHDGDMMWCEENPDGDGVRYVRADEAKAAFDETIEHLEESLAAAEAELAALRDSLPKDKSGVSITPNMRLWHKAAIWETYYPDTVDAVHACGMIELATGHEYCEPHNADLYRFHPLTGLTPEQAEASEKEKPCASPATD